MSKLFVLASLWIVPFVHAAPATAQHADAEVAAFDVDLGEEIDAGVRWLRARQAPDGSYGDGVVGTAWVLHALASSPRHYRRADGPFVRGALDFLATRQDPEQGWIHDPGVEEGELRKQSAVVLRALQLFEDEATIALRAPLEAQLARFEPKPASAALASRAEATELAHRRLDSRKPDGSWDGADGAVVETSRALVDLARAWKLLKPAEPASQPATLLPPFSPADRKAASDALHRGALFLVALAQDGRWGAPGAPDAGLTGMVLGALLTLPAPRPTEVQGPIDQGLAWLVTLQGEDGAISDGKLKNYQTSAAILALARSGKPEYLPVIERARAFVLRLQADETEGYTDGDMYYGGIGYGSTERPDLSNLQMALEALAASGSEAGDEAFRKALKFLERTQNRSESNDTRLVLEGEVVVSGNDGGAGYMPGDSKAGFDVQPDGTKVPRSYGSMTYALLKGFVFAGLPKDDPRMQAAWEWIRAHYSLDVNPGFERSRDPRAPYQGLFYYFHSMARALHLFGEERIVDAQGVAHDWRREPCGRIVAMQRKDDGSWLNDNSPRWWEGNPILATAYAMLTLDAAMPPATAEAGG